MDNKEIENEILKIKETHLEANRNGILRGGIFYLVMPE